MIKNDVFKEITALKAELDRKIKEEGEAALKSLLSEFFSTNPNVIAIKWHQYTPYFNDGDECVFGVTELDFQIDDSDDGGDYEDGFYSAWSLQYYLNNPTAQYAPKTLPAKECLEAMKELDHLLRANEEILQAVFGDHMTVTVNPESIQLEEFYHD